MKQSTGLMNIKLSENFRLGEFYVSEAHPVVARNMEVLPEHIASFARLCCTLLQPIRDKVAHSIKVNSGFRTGDLNMLLGGSKTSQHLRAEAADIDLKGNDAWKTFIWLFEECKEKVGQVIIYLTANKIPYFIHVSMPAVENAIKPIGDFRVKLHGDGKYYRLGKEPIPISGIELPSLIKEDIQVEESPVENSEEVKKDEAISDQKQTDLNEHIGYSI